MGRSMLRNLIIATAVLATGGSALADSSQDDDRGHGEAVSDGGDQVTVRIHAVGEDGTGAPVGRVVLRQSRWGVLVIPDLAELQPGPHATHVHAKPTCDVAETDGETVPGGAAGGHLDPAGTGHYAGPYGDGALGDLPNLYVEADGTATIPVLAPRPELADLRGHSLMIHHGADRYGPRLAGKAESHQHGGMRMYCGVIPE